MSLGVFEWKWGTDVAHGRMAKDGVIIIEKWVGAGPKPTPGEIAAAQAEWQAQLVIQDVKIEAERRINAGTLINGVHFKCNEPSVNRVMGMVERAERVEKAGGAFKQSFTTDAGSVVTVTGAAEAEGVFLAASGYVGAVIEASSALQTKVAAMTPTELAAFDAADPVHWP